MKHYQEKLKRDFPHTIIPPAVGTNYEGFYNVLVLQKNAAFLVDHFRSTQHAEGKPVSLRIDNLAEVLSDFDKHNEGKAASPRIDYLAEVLSDFNKHNTVERIQLLPFIKPIYDEVLHLLTSVESGWKRLVDSIQYRDPDQNLEAFKFLIRHGLDVKALDKDGFTALNAIMSKIIKTNTLIPVAKLLIEMKANLETRTPDNIKEPPILYLARHVKNFTQEHLDVFTLLVEAGANVNATDMLGFTALQAFDRHLVRVPSCSYSAMELLKKAAAPKPPVTFSHKREPVTRDKNNDERSGKKSRHEVH